MAAGQTPLVAEEVIPAFLGLDSGEERVLAAPAEQPLAVSRHSSPCSTTSASQLAHSHPVPPTPSPFPSLPPSPPAVMPEETRRQSSELPAHTPLRRTAGEIGNEDRPAKRQREDHLAPPEPRLSLNKDIIIIIDGDDGNDVLGLSFLGALRNGLISPNHCPYSTANINVAQLLNLDLANGYTLGESLGLGSRLESVDGEVLDMSGPLHLTFRDYIWRGMRDNQQIHVIRLCPLGS